MVSSILSQLVNFAWGLPLVLLLVGGGLGLAIHSRFLPLRGFSHAFRLITGRFKHEGDAKDAGQISSFQALTTALSATVGLGNIAGVAIAISQGGPGAIFWMWVSALVGMNTKFYECVLAVMHRGKDYRGQVQGGAMYVIKQTFHKRLHFLAYLFAIFGMLGTLPLFQINQLSNFAATTYGLSPWIVGLVCAILIAYVLSGGIQRLVKITSSLVPFMCLFYVICALLIVFLNFERVPGVFAAIFREAFTRSAAFGGAIGIGFIEMMKLGVKRAAFSNEAGLGTAPMAHGNVKTSEPVSEGLVAMLGPFFDTIIICTLTALVILTSFEPGTLNVSSGLTLTMQAFEANLPGFGVHFLSLAAVLFSFTTMVGTANYGEKCWNFLFRGRFIFTDNTFIAVYALMVFLGSIASADDVINLIDTSYAFMAWPNMIMVLFLAGKAKKALNEYYNKYSL